MSEKLQVMQLCTSCQDMLALLALQPIHSMRGSTMQEAESSVHALSSSKVSCHLQGAEEHIRRHAALHSKILFMRSRGLANA